MGVVAKRYLYMGQTQGIDQIQQERGVVRVVHTYTWVSPLTINGLAQGTEQIQEKEMWSGSLPQYP